MLPLAPGEASEMTVAELVSRIGALQRNENVVVRARLVVADSGPAQRSSVQFQMKGRRDGDVTWRLYQILWPTARLGQALCFSRTDAGVVSGFLFEPPDKVTPLTPALLAGPFLDSDLSLEDLTEDFWQWPAPTLDGTVAESGEFCAVVDLRPPAERAGSYGRVRAWISLAKNLQLRVEKFDREGRLAKRFVFSKLAERNGLWAPRATEVQVPGTSRKTTIEISRGERVADLPPAEFTLEGIRQFAARAAQEAAEASAVGRGNSPRR
jgi:hypothetical protein